MMNIKRRPDWETRLIAWLGMCQSKCFKWGSIDCMMFAAGTVKALTGKDPARGHRGRYKSQASSVRYLSQLGHADPAALISSFLPETPCALARRGDLVMMDGNMGICIGADAVFLPAEGEEPGLVRAPMKAWERAWRVG